MRNIKNHSSLNDLFYTNILVLHFSAVEIQLSERMNLSLCYTV